MNQSSRWELLLGIGIDSLMLMSDMVWYLFRRVRGLFGKRAHGNRISVHVVKLDQILILGRPVSETIVVGVRLTSSQFVSLRA